MLSKRHLPLLFALLAVCGVYANSLSDSFHFDDFHTVVDNPAVRSLRNLPRIFTDATAFSVLPANQTYRPVVTATLALDYALAHGYVPFWFHLSTVLWFLVLIVVLFFFTEGLLDRVEARPANRWLALGIAAWFGLHPAMAETVNYVIQRGDLYCTLGCVAALLVFARWPSSRRYGFYLLPFVLAMLSKPPAAVFPLLLLLYVFFFEASTLPLARRWRTSLRAAVPALGVTALLLWLQRAMTPKSFLPSILSPADYRLTQAFVWLRYAGALFLPLHLNVDTDLQPISTLNGAAVAGLLFVFGLLLLIAYTVRRRRLYPIAFGLLWFVITQLPTSLYPLSEVENDHRMFFSFPGLMLAVVWGLYLGYERLCASVTEETQHTWLRPVAASLVALCLCGYAYGAIRRNAVWRSEDTLWADDVRKSPHNGRGLMNYALTRMNAGDYAEALTLYTRALQYTPRYPTLEINLGIVNGLLAAQGHPQLNAVAEEHFQRAMGLAPTDDATHAFYGRWLLGQGRIAEAITQLRAAVVWNPQRAMQRDLLLSAYQQAGDLAAARQFAQETLAVMPDDAPARALLHPGGGTGTVNSAAGLINASLADYRAGRFEQSIEEAKQALSLDPTSAEAWNNVGAGYGALKRWDLGIAAEQQALQLKPSLQIAKNNLHWFEAEQAGGAGARAPEQGGAHTAAEYINRSLTLNQQGRFEESIAAAQKALAVDPNAAEAWNNIAASNEAMQRWDQAIAAAQKAVALRPDFQLAKNNLAWATQQRAAAARH